VSRRCRSAEVAVRRLEESDLETLNRRLPLWSAVEYDRRLRAQSRDQLVQAVAWIGEVPVGRGMVLFPEHDEYSTSALREGCAEVRDLFVSRPRRRLGVATALMDELERAASSHGMRIVGLSVALDDDAAPARALYAHRGYRHAHGPYVSSANLEGDEGPIAVGSVEDYLVKDLRSSVSR
jgi:GNAT superfamily N-acetyltransferase